MAGAFAFAIATDSMGIGTLRFALSLLVIDAHYGWLAPVVQRAVVERFGVAAVGYVGPGGIAVGGFFVVSGYLIALVLDRRYDRGWHGAQAFYASRALRIYPLYWLLTSAYALVLAALHALPDYTPARIAGNVTLVPYGVAGMVADRNVSGLANLTDRMLIGPAWTLCYDLLFYLLAPWLFVTRRTTWWVAGLGLAYFLVAAVLGDGRTPLWYQFVYETGTPYLFMFACGALGYHHRAALRAGGATAAALFAGILVLTYAPVGIANTVVTQLASALLFAALVPILGHRRAAPRADRALGDLTYATYLLHLPLLILAQRLEWSSPRLYALALTYVLAVALLYAFELPLDRLRDRLYARARQREGAGRTRSAEGAVALALTVLVAVAAGVSAWHNVLRAGTVVATAAATCPSGWTCDGRRITAAGEGTAALAAPLGPAHRIVVDLDVAPGTGEMWAGFVSPDGRTRVGIRRANGICALAVASGDARAEALPDWSGRCGTRRLALDFAGGRLRVVVDSRWPASVVAEPGPLVPVVRAEAGGGGAVSFDDLFVTRR